MTHGYTNISTEEDCNEPHQEVHHEAAVPPPATVPMQLLPAFPAYAPQGPPMYQHPPVVYPPASVYPPAQAPVDPPAQTPVYPPAQAPVFPPAQAPVYPQASAPPAQGLPAMWKSGLFDCMSTGGNLCCNVYWCLPCMIGRNHTAAFLGQPDTMDSTVCCGLVSSCLIGYFLTSAYMLLSSFASNAPLCCYMFGWSTASGYTWWQRHTIRKKYGVHGDMCGDCLVSSCCITCVTCQHHTELVQHGVHPGSCCCDIGVPQLPQRAMYIVGAPQQQQQASSAVQPGYVQS